MAIDSKHFRTVLGTFATGVTVITGRDGSDPVGLTIGSFTSVSLDPPLVGFLPMIGSSTWAAIARSGRFCVNVLAAPQAELCWRFARNAPDATRFDGVAWQPGPTGSPILDGTVAWIDCEIVAVHDVGDHHFVVGEVTALEAHDHEAAPLIFFRGALGGYSPPL